MKAEKRRHPRFCPSGILADIYLTQHDIGEDIHMQGCLIDMSYSGIRIKLPAAMPEKVNQSQIKITLTLPNSNLTCCIKGEIRHIGASTEVGLHYAEQHKEQDVDEFMFECIRNIKR